MGAGDSSRAGSRARFVVIGVGNPSRGDDGVGRRVLRLLGDRTPAGVELVECDGEPAALLEAWEGRALAWVVDATSSGAEPGSVRRIDAGAANVTLDGRAHSTHGLGLAEALALGRALQRIPRRLVIYGIEGEKFEIGAGLSARVEVAAERVAGRLLAEIETLNAGSG